MTNLKDLVDRIGKRQSKRYTAKRIRLNKGGYTSSGRYFGFGSPLYHVNDNTNMVGLYVRAHSAKEAITNALSDHVPGHPGATWGRWE